MITKKSRREVRDFFVRNFCRTLVTLNRNNLNNMDAKFLDNIRHLPQDEKSILADAVEMFCRNLQTAMQKFQRDCSRVDNPELAESMKEFSDQQSQMESEMTEICKYLRGE